MNAPIGHEGRWRAAYRALLRCYPPTFRDAFALDMEETFVDALRDVRWQGSIATIALLIRSFVDVIGNGFHERLETSGARMFHFMDVRYAFRLLKRSPLFTLLTVLVLSGGLGLSIFTFSFLHTAMLKPLPLVNGAGIVRISQTAGTNSGPFDAADMASMRSRITTLTEMGAYNSQSVVIGTDEHPHVLNATVAEWSIFSFTHTRPLLGRTFVRDDEAAGAEPVIVLGYHAWKAAFGSDSAIIGAHVPMNGVSTRVIGVMPDGYGFPVASEAWIPMPHEVLTSSVFGKQMVNMYGRLPSGVRAKQAQVQLDFLLKEARAHDRVTTSGETARALADSSIVVGVAVETFPMAQMGEDGPLMLMVLNTLAALILLLACINVTNLLLARSNERARETAVRLALGASRARLIMQSMWESVLLTLAGGVLATALAAWGLGAINDWARAHLEGNLAFWWVWTLDRSAIVAAGVFITITIAVLGLAVSARATNTQFLAVLKDGGARSGGRREGRVARALVIAQVTTVSVLMFFGVLSGIVAYRVAHVDIGYDTHHLLSATVSLDDARYATRAERHAWYDATLHELSNAPSVSGVLLRSNLASITDAEGAFSPSNATNDAASRPHAYVQAVSGAFGTLGVTVKDGRPFDTRDNERSLPAAVVSQALADKYWPRASPVGHEMHLTGSNGKQETRTIVGVVSNIMFGAPFSRARSALAVYVPLEQADARTTEIVFKHRGDADAAQAALHRTLRITSPDLLPPDVRSFDEILQKTTLIAISTAKLFGYCFAFALLLAVSGTYGLMARSIGQRTREIGVRRALGASDGNVITLLLSQGSRQLGVGVLLAMPFMLLVGIGFAKFFPVGVAVALLSGVLVALTIVSVVLIATYVPTRRVIKVELRDALWKE